MSQLRRVAESRRRQSAAEHAAERERAEVEWALARGGQWQGARTRFQGLWKNRCDLRRGAMVSTPHDRMRPTDAEDAALLLAPSRWSATTRWA